MTRPVSLLELEPSVYNKLNTYRPEIVETTVGTGPDGGDQFWLRLTVDTGGWVWINKTSPDEGVRVGFNLAYANPSPSLRALDITLRSGEWIVSRAIEEQARLLQKTYCTATPKAQVLIDRNSPEWDDLESGETVRLGFIHPGLVQGSSGQYTNGKTLQSYDDNRVQFQFCEFKPRNT